MSDKRIRTLVFGGTFDPPHNGHVSLVADVLDAGCAERVIFVPALWPPHKIDGDPADFADRVEMLRLAIEASDSLAKRATISELEAERADRLSYTYETMLELTSRMPDSELILLIGADSLINLHSWYKAGELVENWSVLTFPRDSVRRGSPLVFEALRENWPDDVAATLFDTILDCGMFEVSSTEIRETLATNDFAASERLLASGVLEYIKRKGIYGND